MTLKPEDFFAAFDPKIRKILERDAEVVTLNKGESLITEGESAKRFFYLLQGDLAVSKHSEAQVFQIATIGPGEFVGEMALIHPEKRRSASIIAETAVTLIAFDIADIRAESSVYLAIQSYINQHLSDRLRSLNEKTVVSMRNELEESRKRHAFAVLMLTALLVLMGYVFILKFLETLPSYQAVSTFITVPIIIIFAVCFFVAMRRTKRPLQDFGLTWHRAGKHTVEAVLYTVPILILMFLFKWILSVCLSGHIGLIDGLSVFQHRTGLGINIFVLLLCLYLLFVPLQEFIARSVLQTGFYLFLEGSDRYRKWFAIFLSNLAFSMTHLHLSIKYAAVAFMFGIFWGALFSKQRSLVGVSVSHILIGAWGVILGLSQLLS